MQLFSNVKTCPGSFVLPQTVKLINTPRSIDNVNVISSTCELYKYNIGRSHRIITIKNFISTLSDCFTLTFHLQCNLFFYYLLSGTVIVDLY